MCIHVSAFVSSSTDVFHTIYVYSSSAVFFCMALTEHILLQLNSHYYNIKLSALRQAPHCLDFIFDYINIIMISIQII